MDEYLYLSGAKLKQFQKSSGRLRFSKLSTGIKAPIGDVSVEFVASDTEKLAATQKRLTEVMRALLQSDRHLYWIEDDQAGPGDWVQFEFEATYGVADNGRGRAFFIARNDPSRTPMILLYGSPDHLIDRSTRSEPADSRTVESTADDLSHFLRDSEVQVRPGLAEMLCASGRVVRRMAANAAGRAYLEGWARIIARGAGESESDASDTIVATPLYVKFASRP